MNLVDNSIAACAKEPQPRVEVLTNYDQDLKIVKITVTDNGEGIPARDRTRIFEPYYSTKETGTGLGLAIVKRIIEDHNGFIRAGAQETRGTKMVIEMPLARVSGWTAGNHER